MKSFPVPNPEPFYFRSNLRLPYSNSGKFLCVVISVPRAESNVLIVTAVRSEIVTAVRSEIVTAVRSEIVTALRSEIVTAVRSEIVTAVRSEIVIAVRSEFLYNMPNESNYHPTLDSYKIFFNIISLIRDNILRSDFQTNDSRYLWLLRKESHALQISFS